MRERWLTGVWLGKSHTSDEHICWNLDGSGVEGARCIKRLEDATTVDELKTITLRPIEQNAGLQLRHVTRRTVPSDVADTGAIGGNREEEPEPPEQGRRSTWQITREVFNQYGATPEGAKCVDWSRNIRSTRTD